MTRPVTPADAMPGPAEEQTLLKQVVWPSHELLAFLQGLWQEGVSVPESVAVLGAGNVEQHCLPANPPVVHRHRHPALRRAGHAAARADDAGPAGSRLPGPDQTHGGHRPPFHRHVGLC
jgi:hypothetical protein